jgi:hypothetical protein
MPKYSMPLLSVFALIMFLGLPGCSWFHFKKKPHSPPPSELIVTGVPADSTLIVDGKAMAPAADAAHQPWVIDVPPGSHTVEVRKDDAVVYRESLDVLAGEKRVVTVLSGASRF